jgi:1-acyl-sn-glycerol-3-phosphate acyltransferase
MEPQAPLDNHTAVTPMGLMRLRRFLPFFVTQFFGAFNDNVFKNALIIMITFGVADTASVNNLVNIAAALFILPFLLFSSLAGQLADRSDKSTYIRRIKFIEILIMLLAAVGFYLNSINLLLAVLFLMGAQSAFFGPAKYAILPQHLKTRELTTGNALVESGTFLAILLGTIGGGLLINIDSLGKTLVASCVIVIAIVGYFSSRKIPSAKAEQPDLKLNFNLVSESIKVVKHLGTNRTVMLSVLGISWFWFLGAVYLTQFPNYTKTVLGGDAGVATLLLALFSVGIGLGSFVCEKLSRGRIEAGLVPIGAIGMTIFGLHLGFYTPAPVVETIDAIGFLNSPGSYRVLFDLLLIAVFGGIYIVPLYTLVQHLSEVQHRARVIAANNIINTFFMIVAAALSIVVLGAGYTIGELFILISAFNVLVAIYIFGKAPEFIFRMIGWILIHTAYRVKKHELQNIPEHGAAVIVANHVSYADAIIFHAIIPRRTRFVMDNEYYVLPVLNWLFRSVGAIPVADPRVDRHLVRKSYDLIAMALEKGDVVVIFPEGGVTRSGDIMPFKKGIEKIVARTPVPVVPMALRGMWGSWTSFANGSAMSRLPRRFFSKITLIAGPAVAPEAVSSSGLHDTVSALRGDER